MVAFQWVTEITPSTEWVRFLTVYCDMPPMAEDGPANGLWRISTTIRPPKGSSVYTEVCTPSWTTVTFKRCSAGQQQALFPTQTALNMYELRLIHRSSMGSTGWTNHLYEPECGRQHHRLRRPLQQPRLRRTATPRDNLSWVYSGSARYMVTWHTYNYEGGVVTKGSFDEKATRRLHKAVAAMLHYRSPARKTPPDPPGHVEPPAFLSDTTPDSEDKPLPCSPPSEIQERLGPASAGHCQGMMVPNTGPLPIRNRPVALAPVARSSMSLWSIHPHRRCRFFGNKSHQLSSGCRRRVVLLGWQTSRPCRGVAPSPPHACTVLTPPPSAEPQHSLHVCGRVSLSRSSREFLNKIDRGPIPVQELKVSIRQVPSQPCPGGIP